MRIRMSSGQWTAGCLVMLAASLGGALSAPWAARTFVRPVSVAADRANNADVVHKRTCITIDGKRFEWNYPNPPFGTLSCSK